MTLMLRPAGERLGRRRTAAAFVTSFRINLFPSSFLTFSSRPSICLIILSNPHLQRSVFCLPRCLFDLSARVGPFRTLCDYIIAGGNWSLIATIPPPYATPAFVLPPDLGLSDPLLILHQPHQQICLPRLKPRPLRVESPSPTTFPCSRIPTTVGLQRRPMSASASAPSTVDLPLNWTDDKPSLLICVGCLPTAPAPT